MEIFWCIVLLILGLIIIIKCGDWFVDAASWFAEISGIPKLIVGATIVSLATTLPELLVSLFAAISAKTQSNPELVDMAIGNAVGSVTANTGLILAIALICIPTAIKRSEYALKSVLLICASLVIALFGKFFNGVGILASICLLIIFGIAMCENIFMAIKNTKKEKELHLEDITKKIPEKSRKTIFINILKFITGAIGIVVGADHQPGPHGTGNTSAGQVDTGQVHQVHLVFQEGPLIHGAGDDGGQIGIAAAGRQAEAGKGGRQHEGPGGLCLGEEGVHQVIHEAALLDDGNDHLGHDNHADQAHHVCHTTAHQ